MTHKNRITIFEEELEQLKNNHYIDQDQYETILNAYEQYYTSVLEKEQEEAAHLFELEQARKEEAKRRIKERQEQLRVEKEKKKLTPEQLRERNISLSLIAGVVLLLLGGLVLATSSWDKMNHMMKVFSIGGVSLLFFGISYISSQYLKIAKTAFAFLTLASLLIPVTFVGIGYFQLFGEWLSLFGDGKYVLGILATVICLPLYTSIAYKNKNRLFVWLSFLTLTAFTGFVLAATYVPIDLFYLGIIVYNGLLLVVYHYLKNVEKYGCFVRELPLFSQANLVISTLFMLAFFQSHVLYSVNVLLTAVIYMAIVFVYKKKEFVYVFTLMFVYGMYQLLEHSVLQPINYIGFALIGIVYILLEERVSDGLLKKIFTFTSGIVSGLAFLYISFEGLVLRADENSIVLLVAYAIIAINYIYLAYLTKRNVFRYLAPIFLVATGYQSWNLLSSLFNFKMFEAYMFAVGVVLFFFLYVKNDNKYLQAIQNSSFYIAIATMSISIGSSYVLGKYLELSFLLLAFGLILMVINKVHQNKDYQELSGWILPISWLLAFKFIYDQYAFYDHFYINEIGMIGHLGISSLLLLAISYGFKTYRNGLFSPMFSIALIGYTISLLSSFATDSMAIIKSGFYLIGILLYIVLVFQTKNKHFWTAAAIATGVFFLSLIEPLHLYERYSVLVISLFFVPVILLLIYEFVGRKLATLKAYFFWTAHSFLAVFIVLSLGLYVFSNYNPAAFLIPLFVYAYSVLKQKKEWTIKLFLYVGLTTIPINVLLNIDFHRLQVDTSHGLAISVLLIGLLWALSSLAWRKRIDLYVLPFTILALASFVTKLPSVMDFGVVILMTAFTIFLLIKRNWDIFSIVPLFIAGVSFYDFTFGLDKPVKIAAFIIVILLLQLIGKSIYQYLYVNDFQLKKYQIDWFTIITPVFIFHLNEVIAYSDPLWLKLVPPVLFVILLFMQINRVIKSVEKNVLITATALASLLPYYLLVDHFTPPAIIEMEIRMLPFIALTIFLSKNAWSHYGNVMRVIQTVVLVLVTVLIVGDAIESNTIYDAIIVGGLALISIIAGMHYRIKSYFIVGIAVLLLNVFLQTKPFWGNLPWWMYLIFGGATLIGFASFYEWQKQRPTKEGKTLFQEKKEKFFKSFKDWK